MIPCTALNLSILQSKGSFSAAVNSVNLQKMDRLCVISGGPGVGKTTLLDALAETGYMVIPEVARSIIKQQMNTDGDALPWKNKERYTTLMLTESIQDYWQVLTSNKQEACFFDRSVLDAVCYATMIGYAIPAPVMQAVLRCKYRKEVFILPPWKDIYETDDERKQTWKEAVFAYYQILSVYKQYGYTVIEVPKASIDLRTEFVLTHIGQ